MSNKLKQLRAKEGFTIIEVIIVLVIGAVIMLAVFLVVPQLQRTQRNSRTQNDARRILTAAEQYAANNNGSYPTCAAETAANKPLNGGTTSNACTVITNVTGAIQTPTNTDYQTLVSLASGTLPSSGQILIVANTNGCTTTGALPTAWTGGTKFVVAVGLEGGGSFCLQNQ